MILDSAQTLDAAFLEQGTVAAKAVARLRFGTGFLVDRDLLLTGHPILFDDPGIVRTSTKNVRIIFDYAAGPDGSPLATLEREGDIATVIGDPDGGWAAIRLIRPVPRKFPILHLKSSPASAATGPIFIVHHPDGRPKRVSIGTAPPQLDADRLSHTASTTFGSVGAPVFNHQWQVIGMHHSVDPHSRTNWAIPVGRIIEGLQARGVTIGAEKRSLVDDIPKLYISVSPHDIQIAEKLESYLAPLRRAKKLTVSHRGKCPPGAQLATWTGEQLRRAQVVLVLVSSDYLSEDESASELNNALQLSHSQRLSVVPVLVRPAMWQDTQLGGRQCLPYDGQPLLRPIGADDAFLAVARAVGALLIEDEI